MGKKILKAASMGISEDEYDRLKTKRKKTAYEIASPEIQKKIKLKGMTSKCITDSNTPLREVQIKTVEYFNDVDSLLVIHGTGMGKTLTALTCAQCFISQNSKHRVIVVTAASLVDNFKSAFDQYGNINSSKYDIYNFDQFMNSYKKFNKHLKELGTSKFKCGDDNALLIVDEVHLLKNYAGIKFESVMECAKHCKKVLLLTATPYVNNVCDFISAVNLLHRNYVLAPPKRVVKTNAPMIFQSRDTAKIPGCNLSISKITEGQAQGQMNIIAQFLKGKVSYSEKPEGGDYPAVKIHREIIPMSPIYEKAFLKAVGDESDIFGNPEAFYNGYRRAVNNIGAKNMYNDKLAFVDKILKAGSTGNVIFSNWLDFGVDVITDFLYKKGLSFSVISGKTRISDRKIYVESYNRGEISTLVISTAGATGLDLRGTQNLIVIDPVWNAAMLDQIIGRGVRYKSHSHLPKKLQTVHVYLLILVEKDVASGNKIVSKSGDYLLYKIIDKKKKFNTIIENTLKKISVVDNTDSGRVFIPKKVSPKKGSPVKIKATKRSVYGPFKAIE